MKTIERLGGGKDGLERIPDNVLRYPSSFGIKDHTVERRILDRVYEYLYMRQRYLDRRQVAGSSIKE